MRSPAVTERRVTPGQKDGTGFSRLRVIGSTMPAPHPLTLLLAPSIFGGSNDTTRISGRSLRYYREAGYRGAHYPIDPTRDSVIRHRRSAGRARGRRRLLPLTAYLMAPPSQPSRSRMAVFNEPRSKG